MHISGVHLKNFRSFKSLDLRLDPFNVLIGANAAGKSNLVEALRFFRDITRHGLSNAVSMQGGVRYLGNLQIGRSQPTTIGMDVELPLRFPFYVTSLPTDIEGARLVRRLYGESLRYTLSLEFGKRSPTFKVVSEDLLIAARAIDSVRTDRSLRQAAALSGLEIHIRREDGVPIARISGHPEIGSGVDIRQMVPIDSRKLSPNQSILEIFWRYSTGGPEAEIEIYDIDAKLPKQAVRMSGRQQLEEDGSNLAIVLHRLLQNKTTKRRLHAVVADVLPFVQGVSVDSNLDRSVFFSMVDTYSPTGSFPAAFMSDGTVGVLALICAAMFESSGVAVIEEPERNLHPALISRLVALFKEAANDRQIVLTTHSPDVVRTAGLEAVLVARRDAQGFTVIDRPSEDERVLGLLSDEIGLDDLFVAGLLK